MAWLSTTGGYYTGGANYVVPASHRIAFEALIWVADPETSPLTRYLIHDQDGSELSQHFLMRLNADNTFAVTCYSPGDVSNAHHYTHTSLLPMGWNIVGGEINPDDYSTAIVYAAGTKLTVPTSHAPGWTDGPNVNANPITILVRGSHTLPFYDPVAWVVLRNGWVGDANMDLISAGSNPNRYAPTTRTHVFDMHAAGNTFVEPISGVTFTKTGIVNLAAHPTGYENMTVVACSLVDDARIDGTPAQVDSNSGASGSFAIGRNGTGTAPRRLIQRWQSYADMGIPAGSTIISDIITYEVTAANNAAAANMTINRMTSDTWVEGDSALGVTWKDVNYDGITSGAHPWLTGAFQGAPANQGGDCTSADAVTAPMPTSTGSKTVDIATLSQKLLNGGFVNDLLWAANSDTSVVTLATFTAYTAEGTTPPTRVITYTAPAAGNTTKRGRSRTRLRTGI